MALSKKLLSRDEVVVRHMHTHIKVLLWRFVVEILLLVVGVVASVMAPTSWQPWGCLLYTSPSPRDVEESRMPSSA